MSNSQDKNWWSDPSALDNAWKDMHRRLDLEMPEKRRKKAILWWWLSGAAALALVGWFFIATERNKPSELALETPRTGMQSTSAESAPALSKKELPATALNSEEKTSANEKSIAQSSPSNQSTVALNVVPINQAVFSRHQVNQSGVNHALQPLFEDVDSLSYVVTESSDMQQPEHSISAEQAVLLPLPRLTSNLNAVWHPSSSVPAVRVGIPNPDRTKRIFIPEFTLGVAAGLRPSQGFGMSAESQLAWMLHPRWSLAGGIGIAKWSFDPVITQYLQSAAGSGVNDANRSYVSEISELKPSYLVVPFGARYRIARHWQLGVEGRFEQLVSGQVNVALESLDKMDPNATPDFTANPGSTVSNSNNTKLYNQVWSGHVLIRYQYQRWIAEGYFHQGLSPFKKVNSADFRREEIGLRIGIHF